MKKKLIKPTEIATHLGKDAVVVAVDISPLVNAAIDLEIVRELVSNWALELHSNETIVRRNKLK